MSFVTPTLGTARYCAATDGQKMPEALLCPRPTNAHWVWQSLPIRTSGWWQDHLLQWRGSVVFLGRGHEKKARWKLLQSRLVWKLLWCFRILSEHGAVVSRKRACADEYSKDPSPLISLVVQAVRCQGMVPHKKSLKRLLGTIPWWEWFTPTRRYSPSPLWLSQRFSCLFCEQMSASNADVPKMYKIVRIQFIIVNMNFQNHIRIHPNMLPSLLGSISFATSEEPWSPIRKASASPERLDARSECSVIDGWWWMYIDVINECWYNVDRCWWVLWANISHWCPLSFVLTCGFDDRGLWLFELAMTSLFFSLFFAVAF